jgi:SAM-dependent methyltransferase
MLNLACGVKTHWDWNNIDFSPYARLVSHPRLADALRFAGLLSPTRQNRLREMDPQVIWWDLRQGIPFEDGTFDVVYHSHFVEHIDRDAVPGLLKECRRVLKPSGVIRIVAPDLELLAKTYMHTLGAVERNEIGALKQHQKSIYWLFDQMVRQESSGTLEQKRWVQRLERWLRGNASQTGELHRWMYDRHTLGATMQEAGFNPVIALSSKTSSIAGWPEFQLDSNPDGTEYKECSLYMEGIKI